MLPGFRVGLTGGIASGKTTVANLFASLGVAIIDTDLLAREVVAPGTELLAEIAAHFGADMLAADGGLDRRKLRERVFADAAERRWLEARTHPAIRALTDQRCAAAPGPYSIVAIPLLVETQGADRFDRVLVVDCEPELQIARDLARIFGRADRLLAWPQAHVHLAVNAARMIGCGNEVLLAPADLEQIKELVLK